MGDATAVSRPAAAETHRIRLPTILKVLRELGSRSARRACLARSVGSVRLGSLHGVNTQQGVELVLKNGKAVIIYMRHAAYLHAEPVAIPGGGAIFSRCFFGRGNLCGVARHA